MSGGDDNTRVDLKEIDLRMGNLIKSAQGRIY